MARHCQWLIALWDGQYNERRAGTGWVVRHFREGSASTDDLLLPDACPVEQILTRRATQPGAIPAEDVGQTRILGATPRHRLTHQGMAPVPEASSAQASDAQVPLRWRLVWQRIDEFNRLAKPFLQSDRAGPAFAKFMNPTPANATDEVMRAQQALHRKVAGAASPAAVAAAWLQVVADHIATSAFMDTATLRPERRASLVENEGALRFEAITGATYASRRFSLCAHHLSLPRPPVAHSSCRLGAIPIATVRWEQGRTRAWLGFYTDPNFGHQARVGFDQTFTLAPAALSTEMPLGPRLRGHCWLLRHASSPCGSSVSSDSITTF